MQESQTLGHAITWFLQHGYVPSVPFASAPYDLVVESEDGLKRIKVVFTSVKNHEDGSFRVPVHRKLQTTAGGPRENVPYTKADTDLVFIETSAGDYYLIPVEELEEKKFICVDITYGAFKVG